MLVATTQGAAATAAVFTAERLRGGAGSAQPGVAAATEPAGNGRFGWSSAVVSTRGCANAATGAAVSPTSAQIAGHVAAALGIPWNGRCISRQA